MSNRIIITIDGPAGAGKSTTARRVAAELEYLYIDTGAMYRAATLAALRAGVSLDAEGLTDLISTLTIDLIQGDDQQRTMLNGEDVTTAIRTPDVTASVSQVSAVPVVRRQMVQRQREIGINGGVVMDGRDIGSVVFPNAEVKIYLIADITERARRRMEDLNAAGESVSVEEMVSRISERDTLDSEREASPLIKPDGAVEIDTTDLSIDEQVAQIVKLARNYLKAYAYISAFGNL